MNITLLKENDPLLKNLSEPWNFEVDGSPTELVKAMTKIMFENNGIGLAAPQVGVLKRLFIMGNDQKLIVCINPEIISNEGIERDMEGCLSFPNLWMRVKRHKSINVRYQMMDGQTIESNLTGLASRVFQHESDHLDGVCFDDRVGPTTLELAKEKRRRKL
jgi:peptide deformylase